MTIFFTIMKAFLSRMYNSLFSMFHRALTIIPVTCSKSFRFSICLEGCDKFVSTSLIWYRPLLNPIFSQNDYFLLGADEACTVLS